MSDKFESNEELEALDQLKVYLELEGEALKHFDNTTLLRFLRARNLDVTNALQMLKATVAWRINWEVDSLSFWDPPKEISNGYDIYFCGHDYEGRPVYYAPLGMWISSRDLYANGLQEDCLKFAGKSMEMVHNSLLRTKNQNFVCIVDINGATYGKALHEIQNLKGIQDLILLFREYEANYPQTLHKAFVINTPSVFYWGFNIVKPLMTKQTLSKINIFDTSDEKWKSAIHSYLPSHVIPEKLGGTGTMKSFY